MVRVGFIFIKIAVVGGLLSALLPIAISVSFAETPYLRIDPEGHTSSITRLSVDATGKYLVSSSKDKTARLWDLESNKLLRTLRPPIGPGIEGLLYAVSISPDALTIATGGVDRRTYLFERESGHLIKVLEHPSTVLHLEYSPDGRFLLVALAGKHGVAVYETSAYSALARGKDAAGSTYYASWGNHYHIATASDDGSVRLYKLSASGDKSLQLIASRRFEFGNPRAAVFSHDGQKIAVGFAKTSRVEVLAVSNLSTRHELNVEDCSKNDKPLSMVAFAWAADDQTLYGGGECQRSRGKTFIRAWRPEVKDSYEDYRVAQDSIEHMLPLKSGSVVFASNDPLIGVLESNGSLRLLSNASVPDYRGMEDDFLVNETGSVIEVALERGREPVRFAVSERRIISKGVFDFGAEGLSAPSRGSGKPGILGMFQKADGLSVTDWKNNTSPKLNGTALELVRNDVARSLAIGPAEDRFILGTESALQSYDRTGKIVWRVLLPVPAWNVNITKNGNLAVAALGDGTIRWYRMNDGGEIAALLLHRNRSSWIIWTPKGYFDAEQSAENFVGWHLNQGRDREALYYPASNFFDTYYRPDVLRKIFDPSFPQQSELAVQETSEGPAEILGSKRLPPSIQISNLPATTSERKIQIDLEATDEGGGIDEVRVFVNGKALTAKTRGVKVVGITKDSIHLKEQMEIELPDEENTIRAVAYSRYEHIEGPPAIARINYTGVPERSDLHLIAVGINKYRNSGLNLDSARLDAEGLVSHFSDHPSSLFKTIHTYKVLDQEATKDGILSKIRSIQTKPADVVILFLGGHGEADDKLWYFVPYELMNPGKMEDLREQGISSRELQQELVGLPADKILVLLDSCKSGAGMDSKPLKEMTKAWGLNVVAASKGNQKASELGELGHGVFTYALLQGLSGEADKLPPDKSVTILELVTYVGSRVKQIREEYRTEKQDVTQSLNGNDFSIITVP